MSKVILKSEEIENLLDMLKSEDSSNAKLAYQVLENCNIKMSLNKIFILLKFSGRPFGHLEQEAPKVYKKLVKERYIHGSDADIVITLVRVFRILLAKKADAESIELYFKIYTEYLNQMLRSSEYFMDMFQIEFKLKNTKTDEANA